MLALATLLLGLMMPLVLGMVAWRSLGRRGGPRQDDPPPPPPPVPPRPVTPTRPRHADRRSAPMARTHRHRAAVTR